jgi:protein-tyrosine-phosphatase
MAAGIALQVALERGLELEVRSAGTIATPGQPAERRAVAVCREVGIDLSEHRSQPLTAELVAWADLVVVMEDIHALAVRELGGDQIVHLGPLVGEPLIHDPMGSWFARPFRQTRELLFRAIRRVLT